jgi:haloacetate dehalogenase
VLDGFALDRIDVGDVVLRVRYGGRGTPVVLLHGHPRTHTTWHAVGPTLAAHHFVVTPDLGHDRFAVAGHDRFAVAGHDRFAVAGHDRGTLAVMSEPPDGLPIYRVLTGPDDDSFCRRVSAALAAGYKLHGSPAVTFDGTNVIVAQALSWPSE